MGVHPGYSLTVDISVRSKGYDFYFSYALRKKTMEIASMLIATWIYDFNDYRQMYDLTEQDLQKSIVDFAQGVGCFNAQATKRGVRVTSVDQTYGMSEKEMRVHAQTYLQKVIAELRRMPERVKDTSGEKLQAIANCWRNTEEIFLKDYAIGKKQNRYQSVQSLPLPYQAHQFDLALCTDFIFHHLLESEAIYVIIKELSRVAGEVRI